MWGCFSSHKIALSVDNFAEKQKDMEFDKQYYDARKAAIKWLNRDKRDYKQGVDILAAMRFKPLLCKRLSMHQGNAVLMKILNVALRDACKACRSGKEYVDEIPPELEVLDAGTHQPVEEEKQMTEEEKVADSPIENYPPTVQKVYRLFAKAYKDRDKLHRQLCGVGENNDNLSMERRKELSDKIEALTAYMDKLYTLREAFHVSNAIPTEDDINNLGSPSEAPEIEGEASSSLRQKNEDYSSMERDELAKRIHSMKTAITRKQNMLRYQVQKKMDKDNPMPPCPMRTKLETQVRILEDKLYHAKSAMAKFG